MAAENEQFWKLSNEIISLRKESAERDAEIVKLRGYLYQISNMSDNTTINNTCVAALSTPQNTSYLEQLEKEHYGEPVCRVDLKAPSQIYWLGETPPDYTPLYERKD